MQGNICIQKKDSGASAICWRAAYIIIVSPIAGEYSASAPPVVASTAAHSPRSSDSRAGICSRTIRFAPKLFVISQLAPVLA